MSDKSTSSKVILKWVGDDDPEKRHFFGVPQDDLTEEDVKNAPMGVTKKALVDSGLYVEIGKKE